MREFEREVAEIHSTRAKKFSFLALGNTFLGGKAHSSLAEPDPYTGGLAPQD